VTLVSAAVTILFVEGPFHVVLPFVVAERLGGGAEVFGFVSATEGVGALVAALITRHWGVPRRKVTAMYVAWAASCVFIGLIGVAPGRARRGDLLSAERCGLPSRDRDLGDDAPAAGPVEDARPGHLT
jgi:hypothetical protein